MKRLKRFFKEAKMFATSEYWEEAKQQADYGEHFAEERKMAASFWLARGFFQELRAAFWRTWGCDHPARFWCDESWAGPDSGGAGGTCGRCGFSFRSVFY